MGNNSSDKRGLDLSDLSNYEKTKSEPRVYKSDRTLTEFISGDGRNDAKVDFNELLRQAVNPQKS